MGPATAVADPLDRIEFEVGGRWFGCVDRVPPDLLLGVMRRAQRAPQDQYDPTLTEWLSAVVGFLMMACDEAEHDGFVATVTAAAGSDPDGTAAHLAEVFGRVLAWFVERQMEEVRAQIVANEEAATAAHPFEGKPVVRRQTVADLQRIQARHGRKATGEVIRPGE